MLHKTLYICLQLQYHTIISKVTKNLLPGYTPVNIAALNNQLEVLQVLIDAKANVDIAINNGKRNDI